MIQNPKDAHDGRLTEATETVRSIRALLEEVNILLSGDTTLRPSSCHISLQSAFMRYTTYEVAFYKSDDVRGRTGLDVISVTLL